MKIFNKGFNYSQDGYGNRLVYHLQGCNMQCPWCANPEGIKPQGVLVTDTKWLDDFLCPYGAVKDRTLNRVVCISCQTQACVRKYQGKGISLSYQTICTEDMLTEIRESRMMFYDGGGVTFTGGECTLQFQELSSMLKELKEIGIHTAIETNGSHQDLQELFADTGQLILDCKVCDEEKHRRFTGITNQRIMENIRLAARLHPNVHVRVPLIGKVNNSEGDIRDFLHFFDSINGSNITFEILKYHEFGKNKWPQCGWDYKMTGAANVTDGEVAAFREKMVRHGLKYRNT